MRNILQSLHTAVVAFVWHNVMILTSTYVSGKKMYFWKNKIVKTKAKGEKTNGIEKLGANEK